MRLPSRFSIVLSAALTSLTVAAAGCAHGCVFVGVAQQTATVNRSQSVEAAKSLTVESRNGAITVIKDPAAATMQVTAKIRCAGETQAEADSRAAAAALVVDKNTDGGVRVTVTYPPRADGKERYGNDGATIEVRAASLDGINLQTGNGQIKCDGFTGTLSARTSNGGVRVTDHAGPVNIDTSNGAIEAKGIGGSAELETSNGAIDASLADGATGNVNARTSNGSVKLVLPGSWNGSMSAKTSNGRVTINAADGRATNVSAGRSDGSATIGKGTASATVRTSNGSVEVSVQGAAAAAKS